MTAIAVHLLLRPSPYLLFAQALVHLLALAAPWFATLPFSLRLGIDALVLASLCLAVLRYAREPLRELRYDASGWRLLNEGKSLVLRPRGAFVVTPWLLVMPLVSEEGKRLSLVLAADSAERDQLRRLRVALRFGFGRVTVRTNAQGQHRASRMPASRKTCSTSEN